MIKTKKQKGIVLPIAMILLVLISFVGIMAAKRSVQMEETSNNMRTQNVAQQAAEIGLRYCEFVAIESKEAAPTKYGAARAKIITAKLTDVQDANAVWRTMSNWIKGAPNAIEVEKNFYGKTGDGVQNGAQIKNAPVCLIQPVERDTTANPPVGFDGFLITSRGLSNDAVLNTNGSIKSGSEVWLQSVLTP